MAGISGDERKWLKRLVGESVVFDEPMSRHTSFKVGGPADALAAPENEEILVELVRGLGQRGCPYMVVGGGTNLLVKDSGIRKVVIVLKKAAREIEFDSERCTIEAGAGAGLNALCGFALKNGLAGMNFALGIPGSVGGAIAMNAGTAIGAVEDILSKVKVLFPDGRKSTARRETLDFSYRKLVWQKGPEKEDEVAPIILRGVFSLKPDDPEKLKKRAAEIVRRRKERQPSWQPSAGCFFKNPPGSKPAGMLIELAGLKGKRVGGAEISSRHANFIVNKKNASAADIICLKEMVQETIKTKFDIDLEPEVKIVGE